MPYATRNGARIFFELRGDLGPTLVLIRGLGRSGSYWGPLLPLLSARFRLLLIDNRGVGRSDAPRGPYATSDLADDVAHVMDAAGVERAHVFGMSLGGMIAQEVALRHGARVDRLVLGCTTPGGPKARKTERRAQLVMLAAALGWRTRLFPLLVSDASLRARPEIREEWLRLARVEPLRLRGFLGQAAAAQKHDAFDRLARIDRPTLVVTGDDDAIIPHENSRMIADAIPGATLKILPGARHDFTTDQPDASARAILEFLAP
jgi:pimeloyl-ACP methyl ester carboxylesterase